MASRAFADAAGCEPYTLRTEPCDRGDEIIDPQPDVVEARLVNLGRLRGIDRLHQIDLDAGELEDVLVDVLAIAAKRVGDRDAEQIDPQVAQRGLARRADRDLLHAEDSKRPGHVRTSASVRKPGRGALTRIAMLPDGCWLSRIN